jgi:branched-chain amino acid transport system ATP-binding protein
MLEIRDVETYYDSSYVLQGVSLDVPDRSLVALLGRNGVGKTTLVRSIMGLTPAASGSIVLAGVDITATPTHLITRMGVGLVPQGRLIFPTLTAEENLMIGVDPSHQGDWTLSRVYSLFPNLAARHRNRGSQLSGGEQQMLAIGRALMTNPRLLLLDEPSEGLAPMLVRQVAETIRRLRSEGMAILLVEQNLHLALELADKVYIMTKGRVVYEGLPEELAGDDRTKEEQLGIGGDQGPDFGTGFDGMSPKPLSEQSET